MKRLSVISVVLVSLLTLGLLFVSCDSPEDAVPAADDLSFVGARGDNTVIITISQADPSRAVLTPKSGNFYTIKEENTLISKGKITIVGNRWTFTPSPDSPGNKTAFNATYSNETLTIDSIPDTEITGLTAAKGNGVIDERPSLTGTVTISKKTSIKVGDTLIAAATAQELKPGSGSVAMTLLKRQIAPLTR